MMTRVLPLLLWLGCCSVSQGQTREFTTLVVGDKTLTNVVVRDVEPDGLRVVHDGGVAKIPSEQLSPAIRKQYNLSSERAAAHRQAQAQKRRETPRKERPKESAPLEAAPSGQLNYQYIVLKVDRVLPNGDLLCYRHQEGGAVGSVGLALNTIRRRPDRQLHVQSYTEYDKPYYLTGAAKTIAEGDVIRGKAARSGTKSFEGRTIPWLIAK